MDYGESMKWYQAFRKKRTWLLILVPISLIILWIVQTNGAIAEYVFARGIYKWLSQGISILTGILPFSIMELELIILPIIVLILLIQFLKKFAKSKHKEQGNIGYLMTSGLLNAGCTLSVIFFLFVILAGVNYYRYPFAVYSGLAMQDSSLEELYNLNMDLAVKAAGLRNQLQGENAEDNGDVLQLDKTSWADISKTAEEALEKLSKQYPVLAGNYGAPKPVFFSRIMSKMEITGIFWPFTMEANVNIDVPEYTIPATMLHELAHLRGFMREDEANFIAYMASKQSDNLAFQYSGAMLALSYTGSQLFKQDPQLYKQVSQQYNSGMLADLRQSYYYWKAFDDTVISAAANSMNDTYLKANNQDDGVKSYGRMVDLLLAEYRENKTSK
jgi:hypothetical protein